MSCCKTYDPCLDSKLNQIGSYASAARQSAQSAAASEAAADADAAAAAASAAAAAISAGIAGIYLGAFVVPPTTDNTGGPLQDGMLYYNTGSNTLFVWNGSSWSAIDDDEIYLGGFAVAPTLNNQGLPLVSGNLYWNSVTNDLWAYDGVAWVVVDFNEFTPFLATGTTFARNLVTRTADVINVKDFGAVGDGAANDRTALTNAIATGKPVYLPPGTYKIEYNVTNCFTLPANTIIYGDGNEATKLLFVASGAAIPYSELFKTAGENITIKDITIETTEVLTQQIVAIRCVNSFVTLKNVKVNGNVTDNGVATNSIVYAFAVGISGTQNDIKFEGCQFCRLAWPFLKVNASTAINKRLSFLNCDFYENYGEDISLNSPNGEISEFFVIGNNFYSPNNLLNNKIAIGAASCNNGIIDSNIISGEYGTSQLGAIHIEENSQFISVTNNSISINGSAATGIIALWNNISGTGYVPQNISISNNVFNYLGTMVGSNSRGIQLNDNINGDPKNIVITSNVVKNFEIGIITAISNNENVIISNNIIDGSANGMSIGGGGINVSENSTSNCTTGLVNIAGGATSIFEHKFINCTTNYATSAGLRPLALINPTFEYLEFSALAGSNTDLLVGSMAANDRSYGSFIIVGSAAPALNSSVKSILCDWDGAILTTTTQTIYEPGNLVSSLVVSGGSLYTRIACAANLTNILVKVKVNGILSTDL